jgi:hypothetical protein
VLFETAAKFWRQVSPLRHGATSCCSDFRRRLDPIARRLLHLRYQLALGGRRAEVDQRELLDAEVAIALEVVARDRLGVGREREVKVGALAAGRPQQLVDPLEPWLLQAHRKTDLEHCPDRQTAGVRAVTVRIVTA